MTFEIQVLNYLVGMPCIFEGRQTYISILRLASSSKNCSLQELHSSKTRLGTFTLPYFVSKERVLFTRLISELSHIGHDFHLDSMIQPSHSDIFEDTRT